MRGQSQRRRYLKVRLTPAGWVFAIAFGLTISAALNTGINLLYMLAAAVLSFLIVSYFLAWRSLRRVNLHVAAPRAAHRDQEVALTLTIENRKWLSPLASTRIESSNAWGEAVGYVRVISAKAYARLRVREVFPRRGSYSIPAYTLVTRFPFGLVEGWKSFSSEGQILVYPRVHPLRTSAAEQTSGSRYRSRTVAGDGDEFYSMREYLPGDDIRRISWRTSARMGKLMIRELARQNSRFVLFLLDTRRDPVKDGPDFDERFEQAIELVASLGVTLLERQYNIAIECPQGHLESGEGSGQKRRMLEFLARIEATTVSEYPVFDENHCKLDTHLPALLMVSPDPAMWGRRLPGGGVRVLDPREVIHA